MKLRGGYLYVLELRFALLHDVVASFWLAVAAAARSGGGELSRTLALNTSSQLELGPVCTRFCRM